MRLVVDASTLVAEALRVRGRALLTHTGLDLVVPIEIWTEFEHELEKRVALIAARGLSTGVSREEILTSGLDELRTRLAVVPAATYAAALTAAYRRIPRDPRDAPAVALALTLECGILTGDYDFFGCGVPVWTVETLRLHLEVPDAKPREPTAADEPTVDVAPRPHDE